MEVTRAHCSIRTCLTLFGLRSASFDLHKLQQKGPAEIQRGLDGTSYESRYRQSTFIFSDMSRRALGRAQNPIYWMSVFLVGGKVAGA
jgi:hypothetical protein